MKATQQPKPWYEDLTAADIKACQGFENISDELALQIADAIRGYTEIVYRCFKERRFDEQQRAKVVFIDNQESRKAA